MLVPTKISNYHPPPCAAFASSCLPRPAHTGPETISLLWGPAIKRVALLVTLHLSSTKLSTDFVQMPPCAHCCRFCCCCCYCSVYHRPHRPHRWHFHRLHANHGGRHLHRNMLGRLLGVPRPNSDVHPDAHKHYGLVRPQWSLPPW